MDIPQFEIGICNVYQTTRSYFFKRLKSKRRVLLKYEHDKQQSLMVESVCVP